QVSATTIQRTWNKLLDPKLLAEAIAADVSLTSFEGFTNEVPAVVEDNQLLLRTIVQNLNNCVPLGFLQVNQDLLEIVTDDFLEDVSDLDHVQFVYDERECSLNSYYEEARPQFNTKTKNLQNILVQASKLEKSLYANYTDDPSKLNDMVFDINKVLGPIKEELAKNRQGFKQSKLKDWARSLQSTINSINSSSDIDEQSPSTSFTNATQSSSNINPARYSHIKASKVPLN
ncbi:unnamed protein product, partial [Meganyctiphanes norvegica]